MQSTSATDGQIATIERMRDGDRLRAILDRHGKKPGDLERATGKSRQMVHVYLTMARFSADVREKLSQALGSLGIDPSELTSDPTAITDPADLRRLLDRIPSDALPDVRRMLEIRDRTTVMGLLALIDDRIERRKQ